MSFSPFQGFRGFGGGSLGLDADVAAFATASGATDLTVLNQLAVYLKSQSLWTHCRIFPFKSAQNKGSGTTVYGLGGWTSNHITTVGGPTWGSSGMAFDAVDDRGTVSLTGIESTSELFTFDRQKPGGSSLADTRRTSPMSLGDASTGWIGTGIASGFIAGETVAIGLYDNSANRRLGTSGIAWTAGADLQLVTRFAASGSGLWKSKVAATMSLSSGTNNYQPSQAGWTTNSLWNVGASLSSGSYVDFTATTRVALLLCKTALTTQQREAITDYLDAL